MKLVKKLHAADFNFLPLVARVPLPLGYAYSFLRGWFIGRAGWDWRSIALETRHVLRQSKSAYRLLCPDVSEIAIRNMVRKRFEIESREEFESCIISANRLPELVFSIRPEGFIRACQERDGGLVLLTTHFDSFAMGVALLGRAGLVVNGMSSALSDPRICEPVRRHYYEKYRGIERYSNGGRILDMEDGLKPFYRMLSCGECIVILADSPAIPHTTAVHPRFLGSRRALAGGAFRMARKTGSQVGSFVCHFEGSGRYSIEGGPIMQATDPKALDTIYGFFSKVILNDPGRWWASFLLPEMPLVEERMGCSGKN